MAATKRVASVTLNNASGTSAVNMKDSIDGTTNFAGLTGFGTRLQSISIHSGPTTAPGAIAVAILLVDPSATATVIDQYTLTNAVNTTQVDEKNWPTRILPPACTLQAVARTAIASGGTVYITIVGVDQNS